MIKVKTGKISRIRQGDIFKNVEYIEHTEEKEGNIEISKIIFPYIIVLSQDCDLEQDYKNRWSKNRKENEDKYLISVLVAPLYNAEHVFAGEHLDLLDIKMNPVPKTGRTGSMIKNNETPRYHYIDFPDEIDIVTSIIDFKHYFTVNVQILKIQKKSNFVCQVSDLFREDLTIRFANYLARIALPQL